MSGHWNLFILALIAMSLARFFWKRAAQRRRQSRQDFVLGYAFPPGLLKRLEKRRPGIPPQDQALVERALRQYFLIYLKCGQRFVSMPSQVVDDLWHEFILYTKNYQLFCQRAFGKFMHHTPAAALSPRRRADNAGLRRVWRHACQEEGINPRNPDRLPLLFALDAQLGIADGFLYAPDCASLRAEGSTGIYCGGDFSDSSFDGSTDGLDGDGGEGGGDGDGGGDGGSGCGGGCGGGGD